MTNSFKIPSNSCKVALIYPEMLYPTGQPPLGLGYLAAYLRKETDAQVQILDTSFQAKPWDYLKAKLTTELFDLIGISVVTPHLRPARKIASLAKEIKPSSLVIFGGPHPTMMPEHTLEDPAVDAICVGEGEKVLADLIQKEGSFEDIKGLVYRQNGKINYSHSEPIMDLDSLPLPARDLFDLKAYFESWYSLDTVSLKLKGTSIIASRGCPYGCTFCQPSISGVFGPVMRRRSPENIIQELAFLKDRYGITGFMFEDSTFVMKHDWVKEICKRMIAEKLNLVWCCNVRVDLVSKDLLVAMQAAGLAKINIGVESASQRVLDDIYHKQIKLEQVYDCVAYAKNIGLKVQGYFMLGALSETKEEMLSTVRLARRLPFDDAVFDITTPFPGTYLYEKTKARVLLNFEDFDCFHRTVYDRTGEVSAKYVEWLKKIAYWQFYLHPQRILKTLGRLFTYKGLKRTLLKMRRV